LFLGATFPLAVRVLARDENEAAIATARVYAWNTVGSIAGAIAAGFWLVPGLGFEGAVRLAVLANLGLAVACLACGARRITAPVGAVGVALIAAALVYHPARPEAVVSRTGFDFSPVVSPREIFYAVGRSSTVMLIEQDGQYHLLTNGLPEAAVAGLGSPPVTDAQKWLTALAVAARPDTESLLVVGLGGGVALEGVPPSVRRIDVIELEPEVIEANRRLSSRRDRDPLADPRVHVIATPCGSPARPGAPSCPSRRTRGRPEPRTCSPASSWAWPGRISTRAASSSSGWTRSS
jgi:hypothetical protein